MNTFLNNSTQRRKDTKTLREKLCAFQPLCLILVTLFVLLPFVMMADELLLKKNLEKAESGDYVVIAQGKSYTLFHILKVQNRLLTIEEITIPASLASETWRSWVENNAKGNTSWVHYQIDLEKDEMKNYYSFTKNGSFTVPEADNFLATLLKLNLQKIPYSLRRKIGPPQREKKEDSRYLWQPKMIVDGLTQEGVQFDAYSTIWPKDGGPLSGKMIEIYLPSNSTEYPAYFPYWLQAKGMAGQANVRVVDSGKGLVSPKEMRLMNNS